MLITDCNSEGEAVSSRCYGESWDEFVSSESSSTVSHRYGWRRVISDIYGHKTFYLAARRGNSIIGILPLVHVKSRLFGSHISSMPFQDYGGIVAGNAEASRALLNHALQLKKNCQAESLELRYRDALFADEGKFRLDKATLILDITSGPQHLWKSFSPKLRNQIRKAQRSGLATQSGGTELLEEFYRPFAANMRDLGSPVHHPDFFGRVFSEFGNDARVLLVRDGKNTIGGLIALFFKKAIIVPWASSLRRYFPKCPNNLLYWDAIQYACDRGCHILDFGRSSIGSGTYNFKLQWGARPVQLHWQVFADSIPLVQSGGLRLASSLWKHLPVVLAVSLGPHLRKYLTN